MAQKFEDDSAEGYVDPNDRDEKEKLAEAFSSSKVVSEVDETRSSLHYGSDETGDVSERDQSQATVDAPDAPSDKNPDMPPDEARDTDVSFSNGSTTSTPGFYQEDSIADAAMAIQVETQPNPASDSRIADTQQVTSVNAPVPSAGIETAPLMLSPDMQEPRDAALDMSPEEVANRAPEQLELSATAIAENASGAVVGTLSFVDPDAGDSHSFTVSDDRFEVVEGALQLKAGISLDHDDAAQINVEVTVTDNAGATFTETFDISVVEMPDVGVSAGFRAEYFDVNHSLSRLDDIDWNADPTHQEVTSEINYANGRGSFWEGGSTDTFGARVTGNVEVDEGGTFQFLLGGDDGAILFINGVQVIDNDGIHGFRTRTSEVELEPGTHVVEVRYFENTGSAGLKLEWEGPGLDGRELVAAPDQDTLQTVGGIPLTIDLDVDPSAFGLEDTLTLTDLPEGTVITAGNDQITVDDAGSADITGWDIDTLSITPPSDFTGSVEAGVTVQIHDASGQSVEATHPLTFEVNTAHTIPPEAQMVGGFKASYFDVDHRLREIDDIDWNMDPTHQDFVQDINYKNSGESFWEGGSKDTFGAKLEGQITVEEGGEYTFFAGGDDGVILYIDGEPVIDNDGLHGFRTRSGDIELEPGTYNIEVKYFENYGHAGLKLEWDGPDTDGRELVKSDLNNHVQENGTFEAGLEITQASADATVMLEGLPAHSILHVGETSIVSDGGAVDVTGLDTSMLEISPPPGFEGVIDGQIEVTDVAFNGAEVVSHTPFTISVGDVEIGSDPQEFDEALTSLSESNTDAWNADPDPSEGEFAEDDVLSEPIPIHQSDEGIPSNTDTYERVDW